MISRSRAVTSSCSPGLAIITSVMLSWLTILGLPPFDDFRSNPRRFAALGWVGHASNLIILPMPRVVSGDTGSPRSGAEHRPIPPEAWRLAPGHGSTVRTPEKKEAPVIDIFTRIQKQLDATPHLLRLGRLFSETVLIEVDGTEIYLTFDKGRLVSVVPGPSRKTPWRFALRTDAEALAKFWQARPEPGFHDLFGLVKIGRGRIDGDILCLVKNLRFFKDVLTLPREELTA
ncbi:MAG: hypothetical protein ACJAVS_001172 [Paracoccaceae bacterium]